MRRNAILLSAMDGGLVSDFAFIEPMNYFPLARQSEAIGVISHEPTHQDLTVPGAAPIG
jgi:hypothetical protein